MPDTSFVGQIESALALIEKSSTIFAERASALSDLIEHVDRRLSDLPGKSSAVVGSEDLRLLFDRVGGEWGIWFIDDESEQLTDGRKLELLIRASIERKARAVPLLLELLSAIQAEQNRQLGLINEAVRLIKEAM
jgi:hypothetical protein